MVQAQQVEPPQLATQSRDPPAEAVGSEPVPRIQRVTPDLPVRAEVVRRHPRDGLRLPGFVHAKRRAMPPDIRTIEVRIDWHVAEQQHPAPGGVGLQRHPLPVEQILLRHDRMERVGLLGEQARQRCRLPLADLGGPGPPALAAKLLTAHPEQRVRQEPVALLAPEFQESGTLLARDVLDEAARGDPEARAAHRPASALLGLACIPWTGLHETPVACEGRGALVWRQGIAHRPDRQHLPDAEACGR